jgi:hypothetical protein
VDYFEFREFPLVSPAVNYAYTPGARFTLTLVFFCAHVAQSVEHLHGKQKVSGSRPLVGSTAPVSFRARGKNRLDGNEDSDIRNFCLVKRCRRCDRSGRWTGTG